MQGELSAFNVARTDTGFLMVGIDPGVQGALAWLTKDGALVHVADLPMAEVKVGKTMRKRLVPAVLASMLAERRPSHVYLEEVATRPGEGAVGAFAFGRGFGQLEGLLAGVGLPYTLVRPQTWKGKLHVPADKGSARMIACRLWPAMAKQFARVMDDGRAESALIGYYGCQVRGAAELRMAA